MRYYTDIHGPHHGLCHHVCARVCLCVRANVISNHLMYVKWISGAIEKYIFFKNTFGLLINIHTYR